MSSTEEWRDIPGYEGYYQVSSFGRVKSLDRVVDHGSDKRGRGAAKRLIKSRIITPWKHSGDDRPWVSLSLDGIVTKWGVHVLVARAFWGEPPNGRTWALHRDGDRFNNTPGNLYWGDSADNVADAIRHGTHAPWAKLTPELVREARSRAASGEPISPMAREYGVNKKTLANAISGRTWAYVE